MIFVLRIKMVFRLFCSLSIYLDIGLSSSIEVSSVNQNVLDLEIKLYTLIWDSMDRLLILSVI